MAALSLTASFFLGNAYRQKFIVYDEDPDVAAGTRKNITGFTWVWSASLLDESGAFSLTPKVERTSAASEIVMTTPLQGELEVIVDDEDGVTAGIPSGNYLFQLEGTDGTGKDVVVAEGTLEAKKNLKKL